MVLSGPTFDPLTVDVDGADYTVAAEADDEGWVAFSVASVADPDAEVDVSPYVRAIYTAGVQTQLLDGIFERPAIAALGQLPEAVMEAMTAGVADLSSETLLAAVGRHYADAVAASGLDDAFAGGELVSPAAGRGADAQRCGVSGCRVRTAGRLLECAPCADRRRRGALLRGRVRRPHRSRLCRGRALAGRDGRSDRERGTRRRWGRGGFRRPEDGLGPRRNGPTAAPAPRSCVTLSRRRTSTDVDALLTLHFELRYALPVHGMATGAALCAALDSNIEVARFMRLLTIDRSEVHQLLVPPLAPAPAPAMAPATHRLWITVRLADDGRLEHGVLLADGRLVLPRKRFLDIDAEVDRWKISTMIEAEDGQAIGRIRARRLADGRVELGFRDANGIAIAPDILYVPAELPPGLWLRSSQLVAPAPARVPGAEPEPETAPEQETEQETETPDLPSAGGGGAQ